MAVPWSPLFFFLLSSHSSFSSLFSKTLSVQIVPISLWPHCYTQKQRSPVHSFPAFRNAHTTPGTEGYWWANQVSASRSGRRMITGNKLVSGSDEGHETNTWDRMEEVSTSDRAVTEGFSEPPFTLRFRWWGSSHRNIWEKGLSQGKGARPQELASGVWKSGGSLWPKHSQEENKLQWKRRAGPTHVKSSRSMEGSTEFMSVQWEAAGVLQKNTRPDWPSLWLFTASTGLGDIHTHDPFGSLLSFSCSWNYWTILLTLGSLHFMSIYPSILCHLPVTTVTETAFSRGHTWALAFKVFSHSI